MFARCTYFGFNMQCVQRPVLMDLLNHLGFIHNTKKTLINKLWLYILYVYILLKFIQMLMDHVSAYMQNNIINYCVCYDDDGHFASDENFD